MSAPKTNLDRQERRHRGPLIGIVAVVALTVLGFVWYTSMEVAEGDPGQGTTIQIDGRTGNQTEGTAAPATPGTTDTPATGGAAPGATDTPAPDATAPTGTAPGGTAPGGTAPGTTDAPATEAPTTGGTAPGATDAPATGGTTPPTGTTGTP